MNPAFDLENVDVDGAIRETGEHVDEHTRASFFKKAAIGGGAVLSSSAIMGMLPEVAGARPSRRQDIAILNFALTLEYLEAQFYREAVAHGFRGNAGKLANVVAGHEQTHVTTLIRTVKAFGGKPVRKPKFDFKGTNRGSEKTFLQTSFKLENTGVHAYLGQAGNLQSKKLLAAAASIVTVEARHASAFALLVNRTPFDNGIFGITPDGAFDRPFSEKTVLNIAKPFIK